jgi:hypothetical protein
MTSAQTKRKQTRRCSPNRNTVSSRPRKRAPRGSDGGASYSSPLFLHLPFSSPKRGWQGQWHVGTMLARCERRRSRRTGAVYVAPACTWCHASAVRCVNGDLSQQRSARWCQALLSLDAESDSQASTPRRTNDTRPQRARPGFLLKPPTHAWQ